VNKSGNCLYIYAPKVEKHHLPLITSVVVSDIPAGDGKIANLFTVYYLCVQYMYNYPNSSSTGSFCGPDPLLRLTVSLRLVIQIFGAKLNLMVNLIRQ
jgi:hypothetical protein